MSSSRDGASKEPKPQNRQPPPDQRKEPEATTPTRTEPTETTDSSRDGVLPKPGPTEQTTSVDLSIPRIFPDEPKEVEATGPLAAGLGHCGGAAAAAPSEAGLLPREPTVRAYSDTDILDKREPLGADGASGATRLACSVANLPNKGDRGAGLGISSLT
jgi:hypothetical protein